MAGVTAVAPRRTGARSLVATAFVAAAIIVAAAAPGVTASRRTGTPGVIPPGTTGSIFADAVYRSGPASSPGCPETLSITGPLPTAYHANGTTFRVKPADIKMNGVPCRGTQPDTALLMRFGQDLTDAAEEMKYIYVRGIQVNWPGAVIAIDENGMVDCEPQVKRRDVRFRTMVFLEVRGKPRMELKADVEGGYCFMDLQR